MKAVEMKNISVYFGNICALEDINLEIEDKEFLGIIGPNGAGKSTLLRVILGLIKPDSGQVKVYGQKPATASVASYVPQSSGFDRNFPVNVREVIMMGRLGANFSLFHTFTEGDREKAAEIMTELELEGVGDRQIGQLSGGQLQRVLIARALMIEPRIILLDEPAASIDAGSRSRIYSLLKEVNKRMTVVVVTHDMAAVSTYFDNIACLNKKLYYHGEKELQENDVRQVYGCPIDMIAHGVPHRVLQPHDEGEINND